jgi:YidC/Oxa1 family membrane protein insertase
LPELIGNVWDIVILNPMINILIVLSKILFNNLGLTIIVLTILIRALTYPLTRKQLLASKKMQELQPKIAELQKKYAKDKQRAAKEQMALFKEAGVSPTGCVIPMLTQMPIWLALYQSIVRVLANSPEQLLGLSRHLYVSWNVVFDQIPLPSHFLWFDLGLSDTLMILPLLVGISMWIQQKMSTPNNPDPQQQANSTMMLWMMPAMFTFFSLSFPSGLALYWVTSNIISIIMQYFVSGWGPLADTFKFLKRKEMASAGGVVDTKLVVKKDAAQTTPPKTEKRKQSWMFWK